MKMLDLKTVRRLGLHMGKTTFRCAAFAVMMLGACQAQTITYDGYIPQVWGNTQGSAGARTVQQQMIDQSLAGSTPVTNLVSLGLPLDGISDSAPALVKAISSNPFPSLYFPQNPKGYIVSSSVILPGTLGMFDFQGNTYSGAGVGHPETGNGLFNATYTNPWNFTTNLKWEFDPASKPQKDNMTAQALSIECAGNHMNPLNPNPYRNWVACIYRGMDSGSGGGAGTSISSEVDNDVLNLSSNSATDMEIDVNFNGVVKDGGVSRGMFITGGGGTGNTTSSVALDIMHNAYDGTWLPWSTGISIRQAINEIELYKLSPAEAGFFLIAKDQAGNDLSHIDKNGYATFAGVALTASYTPSASSTCRKGQIMSDDNYFYVCTRSLTFKKVALSAL